MAKAKLFFVGIKALIEDDDGKLLVLKADVTKHRGNTTPYWDIPGGRIDEGEDDIVATLKREIEEETGVTEVLSVDFYTAVISNHQIPYEEGKTAGLVLMVYKARIPADAPIRISKEHVAYEWVDRREANERLSNKYPKEFTDQL